MRESLSAFTLLVVAALACPPVFGQNGPASEAFWYLNGRVFFENGHAPPEGVDVESVCDGKHRTEAQTDLKGEFSFRLDAADSPAVKDAAADPAGGALEDGPVAGEPTVSASVPASHDQRMDCIIRASLAGYRSDVIVLTDRTLVDTPSIGTIVLHPAGNAPGGLASAASQAAPKNAQQAYNKGLAAIMNDKHEEAARAFETAVHLYPDYAEAWYQLGVVQASLQYPADSRRSFYISLNADPNYTPPYMKIAQLSERARDWKALAEITGQLLKIAPGSDPLAYLYNSVAHLNLQDAAAAERSAREGIRADTGRRVPKLWYILGVLLANRGDLTGAIGQFKNYLQFAPQGPDAAAVQAQLERCEKLAAAAPR